MADLFKEIVPSILVRKDYEMISEDDEKEYPGFMVNRTLSYYPDTVLIANEMNMYPDLDAKLKYDFLLNIIKPYKRPFVKWHKKVESIDLNTVKEYYGYSTEKALEILDIFTEDQINHLKEELNKGE